MAIQKHQYELSIWDKELTNEGIKEYKQQIIGADGMSHLGQATNIHFKKMLNGTHVLTFQMPSMFFNSEKGDYVQNELIENLFNEQKIKLNFRNKWYELVVKDISESKNYKSIMKNFSCSDGYIDELSRTGYEIVLDPELNNSVEEIHNFMEPTLKNSVWQYNSQWNWGDFTEYKEERCYKIPLSLFGGSITAYKFTLAIPDDCYSSTDKKEIININNNEKRALNYSDDLAGQQNMFWNQKGKNSPLLKQQVTINGGYIYIPMSNLSLIQTPLYDNLDSAAQSTETYYDSNLTKYALQPNFKNPNDIIQFIYLPEDSSYTIDEANVLIDYDHTYILTVESFNEQNKSSLLVYYKNADGNKDQLKGNIYSVHSFMWKPVYSDGFLEYIGEKEINKVRRVNITDRTELNVYEDIYVKIYNNKITDKDIKPLIPLTNSEITKKSNYRIMSKINTEMILPTLARNIVVNGKGAVDTSGWEAEKKNTKIEITSEPYKIDSNGYYIHQSKDSEDSDVFLLTIHNTNIGKESVINFGFVGNKLNIEKNKIYALKIETIHTVGNILKAYTNNGAIIKKIAFAEGGIDNNGNYKLLTSNTKRISFKNIFDEKKVYGKYILFKSNVELKNPYIELELGSGQSIIIKTFEIFEAYTRGLDITENNNLEYRPGETKTYLQKNLLNRYSGRQFALDGYIQQKKYILVDEKDILLETDVTLGEAYGKYTYYIQEKINLKTNASKDTFLNKEKWFEENNDNFSNTKYVEEDFEYNNYELNLDLCNYMDKTNSAKAKECNYSTNENGVCFYKKYGFCPYLFTPERHPRKIRTLQQKNSNRFNIIQELSKVFEMYPSFNIDYDTNGKIKNINNVPQKYVYFVTEKGNEKLLGFRYEKNLTNISRTLNSNNITTKLFVSPVDSQLTDTGYCTIQAAEDNLGKNNFIFDFSYYTKKGLLNPETVEADLYGLGNPNELAYLTKVDKINSNYDYVSSRINALTDENYKTLKATNETNLNGIIAAQEEIGKIQANMNQYINGNNQDNDTYKKYKEELESQKLKLYDLIQNLFYSNNKCYDIYNNTLSSTSVKSFESQFITSKNITWEDFFEKIKKKQYKQCGTVGQETGIIDQVDNLTKIKNIYLKQSSELTEEFNKKYENYIKEGTWSDANYLTDNEYYWGGVSVLSDSNSPQVNYNLSVIDISKTGIPNAEMYEVDIADVTYVEDEEFFGVNQITGLPNKEKVLISAIDYSLDIAQNDSISVQNYTTQFNDLFQQITASVQSLTYNENIYKRAQSFTPKHYVETNSLQGTLNTNDLTLLNSNNSIKLDRNGTEGNAIENSSSRYKLTGDGLYFSTNGGASWIQAVSPKGYNMDYAKFGAIDVSKIKLIDKEHVYFLWDKNGINAYSDNDTANFARFNKRGLSLCIDNKVRLRAGFGTDNNDTTTNNLGFYLYDSQGRSIFKTNNDISGNMDSAKISLLGEMFVSSYNYAGTYILENKISIDKKPLSYVKINTALNPKVRDGNNYLFNPNKFIRYDASGNTQGNYTFEKNKLVNLSTLTSKNAFNLSSYFPTKNPNTDATEWEPNTSGTICLRTSDKIKVLTGCKCYKYFEVNYDIKLIDLASELNFISLPFNKLYELLYNWHVNNPNLHTGTVFYYDNDGLKYTFNITLNEIRASTTISGVDFNRYFIVTAYDKDQTQNEYGKSSSFYIMKEEDESASIEISYADYKKFSGPYVIGDIKESSDIYNDGGIDTTTSLYYHQVTQNQQSLLGNAGLYLNNKTTNAGDKSRLFCTIKRIDNNNSKVDNILTILSNGDIMIGGQINGTIDNLPDSINITNGYELKAKIKSIEDRLSALEGH